MSARLSAEIYKGFVDCRDFGFKDQITRSSLSIPSNIAEGMERPTLNDQVKFLYIAQGSAAELITQIYIGMEIGFIAGTQGKPWIASLNELMAKLHGLIAKLQTTHNTQHTDPKD